MAHCVIVIGFVWTVTDSLCLHVNFVLHISDFSSSGSVPVMILCFFCYFSLTFLLTVVVCWSSKKAKMAHKSPLFTARRICIVRTMLWQDVCPSVCLSHAGIVPKQLYISSKFFHHRVAPLLYFFHTKRDGNILRGTPLTGVSNAGGYEKITIFDQYLALSQKRL